MDKKKPEINYCGLLNKVSIKGNDHTEYTINYLKELVNQYKNIKNLNIRLKAYIQFFVNNFSYNKYERDRIITEYKTGSTETTETNIASLFRLVFEGTGVCQQFSQALALTTMIDEDFNKNNIYIHYATCEISLKGKEMGHAINLVNDNGKVFYVDISSMIHAKEGDYNQDIWSFGMLSLEDYLENINKEEMDIVPINKNSNEIYMVKYKILTDINAYHLALNLDNNALLENNSELLQGLATKHIVKYIKNTIEP